MCAIVDANVAHEVFGSNRPDVGVMFFQWINSGIGRLVAGGKLLVELNQTPAREWAQQAIKAGLIRSVSASKVKERTQTLQNEGSYRSNDPHVLALAQVSGARLLYSNDTDLQQDFQNRKLIDSPRGKVYSTLRDQSFTSSHRRLLRRKDLCRTGGQLLS